MNRNQHERIMAFLCGLLHLTLSCGQAASFCVLMTQHKAHPVEPGSAEHDDF
jgi:hypothetical protein